MSVKASKSKTIYRCQECGYSSSKWLGRCGDCGKWNSFTEELSVEASLDRGQLTNFSSPLALLNDISTQEHLRIQTGITEFDRMVGGGMVPGSILLLGGPPGIGKSTLMLEIAGRMGQTRKVLYVSGEESREQIKSRADRLQVNAPYLYLLSETNLENILAAIQKVEPEFLVIDSIQTTFRAEVASAPGSVSQVRECAAELLRYAKSSNTIVFILGHVTKDGDLAGPRVLEHIVDTVLYFETEKHQLYRILRSYKNRFGPTSEIGIFEMKSNGLVEVQNPSQLFMGNHGQEPGSVLVSSLEGSRALILEIQALVTRSYSNFPRRMVTCMDLNRVLLLIAVLENRVGLSLGNQDIFVNITGGAKAGEPAADLGVACAIASAFGKLSSDPGTLYIGEVGLGGEVRAVGQLESRIKEAERLGMKQAIVPKHRFPASLKFNNIKVRPIHHIKDAMEWTG